MALDEIIEERRKNLNKFIENGTEPYAYSYDVNSKSIELHEKYDDKLNPEDKTNDEVSIAGRIMMIRNFGKLIFVDLNDGFGKLQVCIKKNETPDEIFNQIENYDRGDIIGVKGKIFKTKRGEVSLLVNEFQLLTKSLLPLPDKWSGLKDIDEKYRHRHVDLIINPKTTETFRKRTQIIKFLRQFMDDNEYMDVEIPTLQPLYGGGNASPFVTYSNAWKSEFYLSISPELYLKRLLVGGIPRVYTICKNFRNEDVDRTHNPEFTMLECYGMYLDYNNVMDFVEEMFEKLAISLTGGTEIEYQTNKINFKRPWAKLTMKEAIKKYANLDVDKLSDDELKKLLKENKIVLDEYKRGLAIAELFDELCEDKLIQPTIIYDYPKETTGLCKLKRGDHDLIERFEFFINGHEFGNAYSELNDPELQLKFFTEQKEQGKLKNEQHPIDMDYIEALKYGMPPAGGLGIGVDRIVMLFTDSSSIRDVILFPSLKPLNKKQVKEGIKEE